MPRFSRQWTLIGASDNWWSPKNIARKTLSPVIMLYAGSFEGYSASKTHPVWFNEGWPSYIPRLSGSLQWSISMILSYLKYPRKNIATTYSKSWRLWTTLGSTESEEVSSLLIPYIILAMSWSQASSHWAQTQSTWFVLYRGRLMLRSYALCLACAMCSPG